MKGVRVPLWLARIIEQEAEIRYNGNDSEAMKKRLKIGYKKAIEDEEIDLKQGEKELIGRTEEHIDAQAWQEYIENENLVSKVKKKAITFPTHLDRNLADIYLQGMRQDTVVEDMEEQMVGWLETMRHRAETHGKEEELEYRIEDPIAYSQDYLNQQARLDV